MKTVIIMSGIPGSGKSTYTKNHYPTAVICSADQYFSQDGEYRFDFRKLGPAHGMCLRNFTQALLSEADSTIVVDNTNTTTEEIAPYYSLAKAYGATVHLISFSCEPEVAADRNVHQVPLAACEMMSKRLRDLKFPKHWKFDYKTTVPTGD